MFVSGSWKCSWGSGGVGIVFGTSWMPGDISGLTPWVLVVVLGDCGCLVAARDGAVVRRSRGVCVKISRGRLGDVRRTRRAVNGGPALSRLPEPEPEPAMAEEVHQQGHVLSRRGRSDRRPSQPVRRHILSPSTVCGPSPSSAIVCRKAEALARGSFLEPSWSI